MKIQKTQLFKPTSTQAPTLARKILLRILPVVVLSIFVVGLANYFVARGQLSHYVDNEVRMLAQQVATSAQDFLDQRRRDSQTLAETPLINDYRTNLDYGLHREASIYRQEIEQYFLQVANRLQVYDLIAYYDADDQFVAGVANHKVIDASGTDPELPVKLPDMAARRYYKSPILVDSGRKSMVIAHAIATETDTYGGALVLVCDLETLEDILQRTQIGNNGRAYLSSPEGSAVVGYRPTGQADLRHQVPLASSPWQVVVEAHSDEFIGPLRRLRNLTLLFSFAVAVLVSTMMVAGIRWAMRPLGKVTEGTRRLAEGDLNHRLPMPEIHDLKPLAVAFNDMAGKLKERDEQIQARIRELSALRLMENSGIQQMSQESLLRTCLRAVASGLSFDRVGLYWIDRERGVIRGRYMHMNAACNFNELAFRKQQVPLDSDEVLNRVIASREPMLVKDPANEDGVYSNWVQESHTPEFLLAPLCGKDEVFGVLVADNCVSRAPLTEQHRDSLLLFASAAGLSLENTMLIERITDSEARHRTVLDNSPLAILGVSRDHRIRTWNRGAEAIFGYEANQILGQPLDMLISENAQSQFQTLLTQLVQEGTVHGYEIKGRARNGRELDLSLFCGGENKNNFLSNDEWTIVINDVTASRKLQEQLIKSEKLSAVGQLIAGVAHELNNPLQAVVGYSEMLAEHVDQAGTRDEELQHVLENAIRCRKIVDNLLLFVRHGDVDAAPVCIQDAIDGAMKLLHHKFKRQTRLKVVRDLPEERIYVKGNFQQIEQVLINLMNNAYDALETWDGQQELGVYLQLDAERVRIEIRDTGPGVPMDRKEQLFEPLYTTKAEGRGTGLGLPLCRQIIEDHGGKLDVVNNETGGATFYFDLAQTAAPVDTKPITSTEDPEVQGQDVLLLEDEAAVRALLRDVLESQGHCVSVAENVEQARALAAQQNFALVVTDIHLPDGTGMQFFEAWGRHSSRPRPRFLFLTGDIVTEQMEQTCQANGARILQKPVNLRDLRAAVRGLLTAAPAGVCNA